MAAGLISGSQFLHAAKELVSKSDMIKDNWAIRKAGTNVFLEKSVSRPTYIAVNDADETELPEESVDEEPDAACLVTKGGISTVLKFEYHILFSESYSVPILYFNVYHTDGRLLSLDQVWTLVPKFYQKRLMEDRWTFLTQQEHPYIGRPFFQLHPCHTEGLMSTVETISQCKSSNYLVTWLSSVGPVVLLEVPMTYLVEVGD